MLVIQESFTSLGILMERGGPMMWTLFFVILLFWSLSVDRFLFFRAAFDKKLSGLKSNWQAREERRSWYAYQIRRAMLSDLKMQTEKNIGIIKALVAICPLCGLLGTVVGMIDVFDVLNATGSNDSRSIAAGVSQATITTMAGMVGALSGLFIANMVERQARNKLKQAEKQIVLDN
ncbi:MotA/TolQ/ExbB proton channel family protein [Eilatimonas milleporae]|uniref:Biopolymer transport protein ExbB n=1 Tax=Eilatimonas milleporae TaxID=911205 RepID=A0A3M0CFF3_9PROT|nr:MotA/TolQ/ExbB proton channel family protein [Eilatimonas milleporae]RMB01863.1 biopolymer transport protein ExbB [Eilatimonas milleporae]